MDLPQLFPILVALFCFLWFLQVWLSVCGLGWWVCRKTYTVSVVVPYYTLRKCWSVVKSSKLQ
mgnify:CR=1 FL=1|jgi:hypothetical protein